MEEGEIRAVYDYKGFGFIRRDKGKDVFFSFGELKEVDINDVKIGIKVQFDVMRSKKGPRALNLKIIT